MDNQIKHRTEGIPGLLRKEIYEHEDMTYIEQYDDLTNKKILSYVTMYGGVKVCNVWDDGTISLTMPLNWVVNQKTIRDLIDDLKKLDLFLAKINENYKK